MDHFRRTKSTSRRAPPVYRTASDRDDSPSGTEKGTGSFSIAKDTEKSSYSGFQSYHRPMRIGTVASKTAPEGDETMTMRHGGTQIDDENRTGIIAIGMALGSPTVHPDAMPTPWQSQVVTTVSASKGNEPEEQLPQDCLTRSKSRKWGLFGRSKSKRVKGAGRGQAPQLCATSATVTRTTANTTAFNEAMHGISRQTASSLPKKSLGRSLTVPTTSKLQQSPPINSPKGSFPNHERDVQIQRGSSETSIQEPLLNVEIPDVTLERYSVMFASLLERRNAASPRQNTRDRLLALRGDSQNDSSQQEILLSRRKRSADRNLPPIPSLRLESLQINSRARSNTSPAALTPSEDIFEEVDQHSIDISPAPHIVRLASVRERNTTAPVEPHENENGRSQLRSKFHIQSPTQDPSPSKSTFGIGDVAYEDAGQGGLSPPPFRRNSNNLPAETGNIPLPQHQGPKSTNYAHATDAQAPLTLNEDGLTEEETGEMETKTVQHAVEVSIARQISVSREQRLMLGPLQMNPIEGKRLVETKTSTPRLIDPKKDPSSPLASYRKSEWVVLEQA